VNGAAAVESVGGRDSRKRSSSPVRRVEMSGAAGDGKARRVGGEVRTVATWPRIDERPVLVRVRQEMRTIERLTSYVVDLLA
jgi:hypothetical protein